MTDQTFSILLRFRRSWNYLLVIGHLMFFLAAAQGFLPDLLAVLGRGQGCGFTRWN